jgi:hypothetical protein
MDLVLSDGWDFLASNKKEVSPDWHGKELLLDLGTSGDDLSWEMAAGVLSCSMPLVFVSNIVNFEVAVIWWARQY